MKDIPLLVAMGRLTRQKGFDVLIESVALLKPVEIRLIILGEGGERGALERRIRKRGLCEKIDLPGFVANPYPFLARADLFVLSSRWEGSPNVLTEALALGTPVVATDCPSGPREILQNGAFGPLVPVNDARALAAAIKNTLENPLPASVLQSATAEYTVPVSSRRYLAELFPENTPSRLNV